MATGGQDGAIGFVVQLDRREIDHRVGVAFRQHAPVVRVAGGDGMTLHRFLHTFGGAAADCDDLRAICQTVEFGQIVALGNIAVAE
jgi:hypothetical protein